MLNRQKPLISFCVFFFSISLIIMSPAFSFAAGIVVGDSDVDGDVCITIEDAPNEVCIFSIRLRVNNPLALEYNSIGSIGGLVTNFSQFNVTEPEAGVVSINGVEAGPDCIAQGSSGTLVCLNYDVLDANEQSSLCLEDPLFDVSGWVLECGFTPQCTDGDDDGYAADGGGCGPVDCDDADPDSFPGADELCDGLDNDCDGSASADEVDVDVDGVMICEGDCDDDDPAVKPGAVEVCDGINNDCDLATGDGSGEAAPFNSIQHGVCFNSLQACDGINGWIDDFSSVTGHEVDESSCDQLDNDCDRWIDEGCAPAEFNVTVNYPGNQFGPIELCSTPDQPLDADPDISVVTGNGEVSAVVRRDDLCSNISDAFTYCVDFTQDNDFLVEIMTVESSPVVPQTPGSETTGFLVDPDYLRATSTCISNTGPDEGSLIDEDCATIILVNFDSNVTLNNNNNPLPADECSTLRIAAIDPGSISGSVEGGVAVADISLVDSEIGAGTITVEMKFELMNGQDQSNYNDESLIFEIYSRDDNMSPLVLMASASINGGDAVVIWDSADPAETSGIIRFTINHLSQFAAISKTCTDADGDGYFTQSGCPGSLGVDCNDNDFGINPGVSELCGDRLDNNCDGIDEGCGNDPDILVLGDDDGSGCSVTSRAHHMPAGSAIANIFMLFLPLVIFRFRKNRCRR